MRCSDVRIAQFKELEAALDALSVFDTRHGMDGLTEFPIDLYCILGTFSAPARRITDFMTMTSAEILPETMSKKFSFGSRMSSASFGPKPKAKVEETGDIKEAAA